MTDRDLAQLQLGVYGSAAVAWDYFEGDAPDQSVVYGIKIIEGVSVIVLRGSVALKDWVLDLMAIANPFNHTLLGPVHPGFSDGMYKVWSDIKSRTSAPRVVVGHSLGAARAAILTGLMILDSQAPKARVVWGEPKPGFGLLANLIKTVPTRSYRNGDGKHHDLVTDVPFSFPPEEYVHSGTLIDVRQDPGGDVLSRLGAFAWHHMPLYAAATPPAEVNL